LLRCKDLKWKILGTMILDVEETKDIRMYPKECNQEMLVWFLMSVSEILG